MTSNKRKQTRPAATVGFRPMTIEVTEESIATLRTGNLIVIDNKISELLDVLAIVDNDAVIDSDDEDVLEYALVYATVADPDTRLSKIIKWNEKVYRVVL